MPILVIEDAKELGNGPQAAITSVVAFGERVAAVAELFLVRLNLYVTAFF